MIRKKLLLVAGLLCSVSAAFAQHELMEEDALLFGWNRNFKHQLRVDYESFIHSNSVTNGLVNTALAGEFIDADTKQAVSDKLGSNNRFGFGLTGRLQYKHIGEKLNLLVGLRSRDHLDARFSSDVANLIMWGNAPYAGTQMDLSPLRITYFHTQELSLGLEKTDYGNGIAFGGGLTYLKGARFAQANITRGDFYTEEYGAFVELDLAMEYRYGDADVSRTAGWYGNGVALDGWFYKELGNAMLVASISDVGVVSWSDLTTYKADTLYRFEGVEVDNVLQLDDSLFADSQTDSLPAVLELKAGSGSHTYMLPADINVRYVLPLTDKTNLLVGVRQLINGNYRTRLRATVAHRFSDKFALKGTLAYGGYSRLDAGLGAAFDTGGSFRVSVDAFYLETLLSSKSSGSGLQAAVMVRF